MQRHTFLTLEIHNTIPATISRTCHRSCLKELTKEATREVAHPLIEIIDGRGGTAALE
jgi:hypothetical protein